MVKVLKYLGVFIAWNLVAGMALMLTPPPVAFVIALLLFLWLLGGYLLYPEGGNRRRWADIRIRPLRGPALRWSLAAAPVALLLSWSITDLYTRLVPVPEESLNPFGEMLTTPADRLLITFFAIGIAPVAEEFFFRGLIQHNLERLFRRWFGDRYGARSGRRLGVAAGITVAAAIFSAVHALPWVFPVYLFLGMAFGFMVWVTESIWAGVLLHAVNNVAATLSMAAPGGETPDSGTLLETGAASDLWPGVISLLVTGTLAFWIGRQLVRLRSQRRHPASLPTDSGPAYLP
ncbi:MAG: CPBP family intramembrane metalloprotease [Gemmatimonadota bacterium]|jgi:membrane protease YdiL (CAAX protease family)|nr:CPBP family intramembrane metalloprotease [Gemmatimonadota bacterium]